MSYSPVSTCTENRPTVSSGTRLLSYSATGTGQSLFRFISLSTSNSVDDLDHSRPGRPMPNKSHGVAGGNVEKAVIICMQSESDGKRPGRISLRFEHKIELSD
jgi:hypothetical protein